MTGAVVSAAGPRTRAAADASRQALTRGNGADQLLAAIDVTDAFPLLRPHQRIAPDLIAQLPQHGFARDLPWRLEPLADGRGVAMLLEDSEQSRRSYPYAFCLTLEVRLAEAALEFSITVENRSTTSMPFSFGLHPYFQVSSLDGLRIEGLPPCSLDQVTMTEVNSEQHVDLMAEGIDMLSEPSGAVRLVDGPGRRFVELQPSGPLDLVVIWTDPPRSMVCLEPWTAPRGSLVSGDRRIDLASGARQHLSTRYRVGVECY